MSRCTTARPSATTALPSADADRQLGRVNGYFQELEQRRALRFVDLKKALKRE